MKISLCLYICIEVQMKKKQITREKYESHQ